VSFRLLWDRDFATLPLGSVATPGEAVRVRRWGRVIVVGRSMEPTLRDGDRLVVRWGCAVSVGDVAVVRLPGHRPLSVKRVVHRDADGWWVERDNPAEGVDSWAVGAIPDADVLGVVRRRYWPARRAGRIAPPPVPLG
jgi:signal peptidase I